MSCDVVDWQRKVWESLHYFNIFHMSFLQSHGAHDLQLLQLFEVLTKSGEHTVRLIAWFKLH